MEKYFAFIGILLFCGQLGAQTAAVSPSSQPRSHVERFSTPETRAEKIERDAAEKLESDPNNAELLNERALARLRLNKFREAFEDLQKAVRLDAKNADYRANLGYALWKLGRGAEAIEAEREALKINEKNYTANYQLGRFLLRTGDKNLLPEAAERLKKALEIDPRQYEVRFELIAAFRELGDTAAALGQLDILQDARPSDARVKYVAALLFIDRRDFDAAIENFRSAVGKDPNLYGAWQDLGLAYVRLNQWENAGKAFSELARRQQDSVEAAYLHALTLYNTKKIPEAEAETRRALRINPGFADAHTLLGIILASRGGAESSNREALENLTQAVALAPNNFDARFYLGRVQYLMGNFGSSLENLRRAVQMKPENIEARFFLGTLLEKNGESEKALEQYQAIVERDEKSFYGQVGLGALFVKQGKLAEAVAALRRAVELEETSFEAHWALGRAFILEEKFAEAEAVLKKAVELQPARTDARYQYALALRRLGKTAEAQKEFELVEKLNKEFREGND